MQLLLLFAFSCEQFQGIAHIKRVDVAVVVVVVVFVVVFVAGTLRLDAQLICAPKRTHVSVRYISESVGRRCCCPLQIQFNLAYPFIRV